jgi:hypothetical protein
MCKVPKSELDNLESSFEPRTEEKMLDALNDAVNGIYPGWEKDRGVDQHGKQRPPLPLFSKNCELYSRTRKEQAASRIGRHLLVTFFDDLNGVDLHTMVNTFVLPAPNECVLTVYCVYCLCTTVFVN